MNLKIFLDGTVDDDWEITDNPADIQHIYDSVLWEMEEYSGDTADDFVVLHDKTVYQILVILKATLNRKVADSEVLNDLQKLAQKDL